MKHEFSTATLDRAKRIAIKHGHITVAALIDGRPLEPEEKLFDAARRGDEATIRNLLGSVVSAPGQRMEDGTVYAGISPDSGKPLYATAVDAPLTMTFFKATAYAKNVNNVQVHGRNDWRLPTPNELKLLFDHRAAIGGFTTAPGSGNARLYWSCTERPDNPSRVYAVDFTNGDGDWFKKGYYELSSRVVRAGP